MASLPGLTVPTDVAVRMDDVHHRLVQGGQLVLSGCKLDFGSLNRAGTGGGQDLESDLPGSSGGWRRWPWPSSCEYRRGLAQAEGSCFNRVVSTVAEDQIHRTLIHPGASVREDHLHRHTFDGITEIHDHTPDWTTRPDPELLSAARQEPPSHLGDGGAGVSAQSNDLGVDGLPFRESDDRVPRTCPRTGKSGQSEQGHDDGGAHGAIVPSRSERQRWRLGAARCPEPVFPG